MATDGRDGYSKIVWAAAGALWFIATGAGGLWLGSLQARTTRLEDSTGAVALKVRAVEVSGDGVARRLEKIEEKIDRLTETVATMHAVGVAPLARPGGRPR